MNKSKHTKRNVAVEIESLASKIDCTIGSNEKENMHEHLRSGQIHWKYQPYKRQHFQVFKKTEAKWWYCAIKCG